MARGFGVIDRWGAALIAPRAALALADRPDAAGRSVSDGALALLLAFIASHATALVQCGWDLADREVGLALQELVGAVASFAAVPLVALAAAAAAIWLLAGPRRSLGRDVDLAAVGLVPASVTLAWAQLMARIGGQSPTGAMSRVLLVGAIVWLGAVAILALPIARHREEER